MEKPDVDQIDGLSPAISIDQKSTSRNPRSTVATVTEIYDYLRLLFARVGVPHCPVDGKPVVRQTSAGIVAQVEKSTPGKRIMVLAPVVIDKKGAFEHIPEQYQRAGFARARVDGVVYALDEFPELDKAYRHRIEIVVDRLVNDKDSRGRLVQSVEQALDVADGKLVILDADSDETIHLQSDVRLPGPPGNQHTGAGAAHLQLQQPARRLSGLYRSRLALGSRPGPGDSERQPDHSRRRHPAV